MIHGPVRSILLLVALVAVALPTRADARVRIPDPYGGNTQAPALDLGGGRLVATKNLGPYPGYPLSRVGVFAASVSGAGGWRLLHREDLRTSPGNYFASFEASASASRLALLSQSLLVQRGKAGLVPRDFVPRLGGSVRAGALSGPLATLLRCGRGGVLPSPAIDGRLVAYAGAGCSSSSVTVRDPRRPTSTARTFSFGGSVTKVALAGRYLATHVVTADRREVVLLDHSTNQVLLQVPYPTAYGIAVQADGTVAVISDNQPGGPPTCPGSRLEWFSPGQPNPQSVAEPTCDARVGIAPRLRIAGGRIAYLVHDYDDQRLVLAKLDNSPGHIVARSVQSLTFALEGFDWDGARVAYGEARCLDAGTVVAGPEEPTQTFGPLECPIAILGDSARLARDNSVGIRVRCANGCDGGELGFTKPDYLRFNRTPVRFARFRGAPGKVQTVRIRLSRLQAERVRREGSRAPIPVRAVARSSQDYEAKDLVLRAGSTD